MGSILFLLLIFFVIVPLVRGLLAFYRLRRNARQFFEGFRNPGASTGSDRAPRQEQPRHRKKIDPTEGEFVSFEELPPDADSTAYTETRTEVRVEQQVVDVEWEDIK